MEIFSWISQMSPQNMKSVLKRERRREMTHRRGEAEIRVIQPQAKERRRPPEAGRGGERLLLGPDNTFISFWKGSC